MSDPSALRFKLIIGLFILMILVAFINRKIKQEPGQKIQGKGIVFYNLIGLTGMVCFVILIISSYFN